MSKEIEQRIIEKQKELIITLTKALDYLADNNLIKERKDNNADDQPLIDCVNESAKLRKEIKEITHLRAEQGEKKLLTNERIHELAKEYAREHSNAPDKDCPDWIIHDYEAGAYMARTELTGIINLTEAGVKSVEQSKLSAEEIPSGIITKMQREFQPDTSTSFNQGMYSGYAFGLQDGFKFAHSQFEGKELPEDELRSELVKFGEYLSMTGRSWSDFAFDEELVDDYFKSLK